ncbi:MAG TPA: alginate export family protein [Lysobacter sp.]|nr:alginate export family protein [Lysobacter sp.]
MGIDWRGRLEATDAPAFGTHGQTGTDGAFLQRLQVHADIALTERWTVHGALEDVRTFGKQHPTPTDRNPTDLRTVWIAYTRPWHDGTIKLQVGRQELAYGQQRFLSVRDAPNVRQAFDAAWLRVARGAWTVDAFVGRPVQYSADEPFDDESGPDARFHLFRVERTTRGAGALTGYYAWVRNDGTRIADIDGREHRHAIDMRWARDAEGPGLDWDVEGMVQWGRVGLADVHAWAAGARGGYTFAQNWQPRIGLQLDVASGDRRAGDARLQTFNPLFPNGSYSFSRAGLTGYVNLLQLKPSVQIAPTDKLVLGIAHAIVWRDTTTDAVYLQPDVAIDGTAGVAGRRTGTYLQLRADWRANDRVAFAAEFVDFRIDDAIRAAGGSNSRYASIEAVVTW